MTWMLGSVTSAGEATTALDCGVDVIDAKDPSLGALGALAASEVRKIVRTVAGRAPVSAVTGDLDMEPRPVLDAASAFAATGVDYVKVGLFPGPKRAEVIAALAPLARRTKLVGVLFADAGYDETLLPHLAESGFHGAMIDTADKRGGGLRAHLDDARLGRFVRTAGKLGLQSGLSGSLGLADVAPLLKLKPDFLGFRGALCGDGRASALDARATRTVRALIPGIVPVGLVRTAHG